MKGFFEGLQRILSTLSVSSPRQRRVPFQDAHGFSEILKDSQRNDPSLSGWPGPLLLQCYWLIGRMLICYDVVGSER